MRLIFICLILSALVWYLQGHMAVSPMAMIGTVMLGAAIGVRLCERWRIPGAAGALGMGLLLGSLKIVDGAHHQAMQQISHLALVWAGLSVSTALGRPLLVNRRLLGCACCFFFPPFVLSFSFLIFQPIPFGSALQIAAIAGMAAPFFTPPREHANSDTHPISLLTTGFGLSAWGAAYIISEVRPGDLSGVHWGQNLIIFLLSIEAFYRLFQCVRTESGRTLGWLFLALLIALFAWAHDLSPLPLALLFGLALSLRARENVLFPARNSFSEMIVAFAIAHVAITLLLPGMPTPEAIDLSIPLTFGATMCAGKLLGGSLARHHFSLPLTTWLPVIPSGFLSAICLSQTAAILWAETAQAQTLFILIAFGLLPILALWPLLTLIRKIKNGRRTGKPPAPTAVQPQP